MACRIDVATVILLLGLPKVCLLGDVSLLSQQCCNRAYKSALSSRDAASSLRVQRP